MIERTLRDLLQDPSLRLVCAPEFSSAQSEYRQHIRQTIAAEIQADAEILANVLDLSRPLLKAGTLYVSISHCPSRGGFALSQTPIGFDVETPSRLRTATVLRVAQPVELDGAPSLGALWAAKEAAFKALQNMERAPDLLSQIEIADWVFEPAESPYGTFKMKNLSDFSSRGALGGFISGPDFILCAFALSA